MRVLEGSHCVTVIMYITYKEGAIERVRTTLNYIKLYLKIKSQKVHEQQWLTPSELTGSVCVGVHSEYPTLGLWDPNFNTQAIDAQ